MCVCRSLSAGVFYPHFAKNTKNALAWRELESFAVGTCLGVQLFKLPLTNFLALFKVQALVTF